MESLPHQTFHWTDALDHPILSSRPVKFDALVVGPGPPPVYNGADDKNLYSTGWALFDKNDPTKVISRAETPLFSSQRQWEKIGQVPNVVFVERLVRERNRWLFYLMPTFGRLEDLEEIERDRSRACRAGPNASIQDAEP